MLIFQFDFQRKVHTNVGLLYVHATRMEMHGVNVDNTKITLKIITNIKTVRKEDYMHIFSLAM